MLISFTESCHLQVVSAVKHLVEVLERKKHFCVEALQAHVLRTVRHKRRVIGIRISGIAFPCN